MRSQSVYGTSVLLNDAPDIEKPVMLFPGCRLNGRRDFGVDEGILSRHILLLGGSGCGKTKSICYVLENLRKQMGKEDISIVFDTKGEFYDLFSKEGDVVIGNSMRFRAVSHTWNIFDEILADGWDDENIAENAREIAAALFHGRGSSTQPFFCNAARDIFGGILFHFIHQVQKDPAVWRKRLNNADLINAFRQYTVEDYRKIFSSYRSLRSLLTYFGDGRSNQALGVFGELNSMLAEYFVGVMARHDPDRSISMRKAVRARGGITIFVEYDLGVGETLTPVYRLLIDQALKEALGRTAKAGNVYLIADEFKLLPKLQHIDDALNFGRGLGVRVVAGIQSIDQLYDVYGRDKGNVIAGGFGSIFAYHTNDASSREYITKRFGANVVAYTYTNRQTNAVLCRERDGNTVEDWEQMNLGPGQAIIGLGYAPPFLFYFDEYGRRE